MKLAFSHIAWDAADDPAAADVLRSHGITGIELAPTKWRDDPHAASAAEADALRARWRDAGLEIVSLQSLLFGRDDLQLFGTDASRQALGDFLRRTIDLASRLGSETLVFGSPKNRRRGSLSLADATAIAADFFADVAPYAASNGTAICLEANPIAYGADFITTTDEAIALCRRVDHPGFRLNLDLGTMALNAESPAVTIAAAGPFIHHVHASAPNLVEISDAPIQHETAQALRSLGYARWVSVEMRCLESGALAAIERASALVRRIYGDG